MEQPFDILKIFADDKRMILYRPEWRKITGSVTATILLQQIIFHWDRNHREPFYKFKEPCDHKLYRSGDSWIEELGFSRAEFDTALKKIGYKKSSRREKNEAHERHAGKLIPPHTKPVEYRVDPSRLTFYAIHLENLMHLLDQLYGQKSSAFPCQNGQYPVTLESDVTKRAIPALRTLESDVTKREISTLDLSLESDVTKREIPTLDLVKDQRDLPKRRLSSERDRARAHDLPHSFS